MTGDDRFMVAVVVFLLVAILLLLAKVDERLRAIVRLLERSNEMKHEDRTGEWRDRY